VFGGIIGELESRDVTVPVAVVPTYVLRYHCFYGPIRAFHWVALRGIRGGRLGFDPE